MSEGQLVGIDRCFVHGGNFAFDPDTVVVVPIDPVTGLPPDLGGDPGRAVKRPICDPCIITEVNPERMRRGLPPIVPAGERYRGMRIPGPGE